MVTRDVLRDAVGLVAPARGPIMEIDVRCDMRSAEAPVPASATGIATSIDKIISAGSAPSDGRPPATSTIAWPTRGRISMGKTGDANGRVLGFPR